MLSFTILSRFPPPIACSIRMLMEAIRRFIACAGGVRSPPGGFFFGLDDRDIWSAEALEALLLIQTATRWQSITRFLCQTLL